MNLYELRNEEIKEYGRCKSGILGVDAITGGYQIGELTVLCAPTSGGKSLIAIESACSMSEKYDVLYVSCENSKLTDRKRIDKAEDKYFLDEGNMSFEYFNMDNTEIGLDDLENLIALGNYDAVFVDSIDFVATDADTGSALYQNYGRIAKALRMLARKYEVAIITTAQINRQGYEKGATKISVADMADSIKIARQAFDVWSISKDEAWAMKIIKHRDVLKIDKELFCMSSNAFPIVNIEHVLLNSPIGATLEYKEAKQLAEVK